MQRLFSMLCREKTFFFCARYVPLLLFAALVLHPVVTGAEPPQVHTIGSEAVPPLYPSPPYTVPYPAGGQQAAEEAKFRALASYGRYHSLISRGQYVAPLEKAPEPPAKPALEEGVKQEPRFTGFKAVVNNYSLPTPKHLKAMWDEVLARHDPERVFGRNPKHMPPFRVEQWRNIVAQYQGMPPDKKLRIVNGFFNNWPSKDDMKNYGVKEYWASPEEFLRKGSGDCEDYAIIKYLALRYLGWPAEDLWLVLVIENKTKRQHAVLAAHYDNATFILDNLSKPRYLLIPEKNYMKRYTPFYAVNDSGDWLFAMPRRGGEQNALARIQKDDGVAVLNGAR